jgi:Rrf2 family protein
MVDLALHYGKGPVKIHEISDRQDISEYYLQQILSSLTKANLVNSSAESHGGFSLALPPDKISLLDIVEVLEGSLSLVGCVESPQKCSRSECCSTRWAWSQVSENLKETLRKITLEELARKQKSMS